MCNLSRRELFSKSASAAIVKTDRNLESDRNRDWTKEQKEVLEKKEKPQIKIKQQSKPGAIIDRDRL